MITINEIKKFASKYPNASFNELMLATGVSTGCGRCKLLAQTHFDNLRKTNGKETQLLFKLER